VEEGSEVAALTARRFPWGLIAINTGQTGVLSLAPLSIVLPFEPTVKEASARPRDAAVIFVGLMNGYRHGARR
jgi:hypothetical protein